ncbi:MAG: 2-oxoglutarate synthase subunit alpha [Omnitrophica bacterium RIFCSPLOWO2_12_FULL_44_17]|uniref:2-oxoglutarate synthase subunit alpha n=1 Tax=Candidatus Danuiimicrobium aquiferis TaxID=1801832 RepID=A0A1G1L396_9BACT|nr:MAG: 2-oxoglutarate synthase subunit alpha [Omnitrophica bacterium RIFCSPHIGHO2_02_FULL_45_28]OGW89475.1 MAG: 2-oxoglutarate synthase subunit alpha [Omnitrophica bacterium RIFCSPHIGHO2_12_FULL_44_12]OGW99349.1 MAG: 2-oxoglutarate synthase subunit alpha [Omnitrophica bacterium RIFCSPLOWO2_12_FULL_44_17]OGX02467.1 MAG: 2-oxoglutarate synthase subunit alpha [Omnitrophica bacterium RIFCSPLOWO2_02_FULL_44_11]
MLFMQGNEACAQAALDAGMRFFAGYPITPSTEIAEMLSERLPRLGGKFIQMEDEIASMGAILGAALAGKKSMTATSGPGFSLKQELIGLGCLCEIPCVIVNVQRSGPSTGLPTAPAQGDIMQARWGTHGDHPIVVLSPSSVSEMYELTVTAFNIAESLRNPVILLADEVVAHMREKIQIPESIKVKDRLKPDIAPEKYRPYAVEKGEFVPRLADFGDGYRFNVTSLMHDETGFPTNRSDVTGALLKRLMRKVESRRKEFTFVDSKDVEGSHLVLFGCGSTVRSIKQAAREAQAKGLRVGWMKTSTIWPFPDEIFQNLPKSVKTILVCEMNLGQLVHEVRRATPDKIRVDSVAIADGHFITPSDIMARIEVVYS